VPKINIILILALILIIISLSGCPRDKMPESW